MTLSKTGSLTSAWKQWCDLLAQHGIPFPHRSKALPSSPSGLQALHQSLLCFSDKHLPTPEHLQSVLIALSKGKHLVEAALAWEQPRAGPSGTAASDRTNRARGEQWRLVMAYGGFETVLESLIPDQCGSFDGRVRRITDCCALPPYDPLPSPSRQRAELNRWLGVEEPDDEHPIVLFLKLQNGALHSFSRWVVEGHTIDVWSQAVQLAKALRHATAHGALSASKVNQWGLQAAFRILTDNLGTIVTAAIHRLAEPMSMTTLSAEGIEEGPANRLEPLISRF